jgi:Ser/Thr protein kinase RdoA (MazF antagonist)
MMTAVQKAPRISATEAVTSAGELYGLQSSAAALPSERDQNFLLTADTARVSAILDFGDVVHSATVCNLAVALAYVMLDKPDPIGAAVQVVAAYQKAFPLTGTEIDTLYWLVTFGARDSSLVSSWFVIDTRSSPPIVRPQSSSSR